MRIFILFFAFLFHNISFSQQGTTITFNKSTQNGLIAGTVLDSTSKMYIEYAMVRLYKKSDTLLTSGSYTDEKGFFLIEDLAPGTYVIKISLEGYKEKIIPNILITKDTPLRKMGNIALVSLDIKIDEVIVKAERNALLIGLDKKVYSVGDDISVTGGTATDVLNNVPSVDIDEEGKLSLRGDGNVTVLIDGRPSSLTGASGKSILEGIPASSIERIEIVTNPSAKYDPDGTSGIINIVLKKNLKRGLNGSLGASIGTGDLYTGSVALSMRNTKVNLFGNYGFDHREGFRNQFSNLEQLFADSINYFNQSRLGADYHETNNLRLGADWYVKDRNTLSFMITGNLGDRRRSGIQNNLRTNDVIDTLRLFERTSFDPAYNKNVDINLSYALDFKDEKGSGAFGVITSLGEVKNQGIYSQSEKNLDIWDQRIFSNDNLKNITFNADFVRIVKKEWRFEFGAKTILRENFVASNSDSRIGNQTFQPDTISDFKYRFDEKIASSYLTISRAYKNIKFAAGTRIESALQHPQLISEGKNFKTTYFNLFPSATIKYTHSKIVEYSLSYSRRINRPNAEQLNPFTSYADPFNLRSGNPAITPEYIHSFDFGMDAKFKKLNFTTTVYQRFTNNIIQRVKLFYENGTSNATFANINSSLNTGAEFVLQYKPIPFFKMNVSGNANYIQFFDDTPNVNWQRTGFVLGGKWSGTLDLMKKTFVIQLNARANAPGVTAQGKSQPRGAVDVSFDKSFDSGKWGITFRVTDIFNTQGHQFTVQQPMITQNVLFKWETRRAILAVRYKFGKNDFQQDPKKSGGESSSGGFDF
jgi:outer membrane receptor protein involved in Fe transport